MATYQDDQGNSYASIQITWDANTELDLAHYVVEWSRDGSDWQSTQVDNGATSCVIDGLACGADYYFRVKAVDRAGNESGYSDVNSGDSVTMSSDTTAPDDVTDLTTYSLNKAIKLTWTNPSQKDFSHCEVWRASDDGGAGATKIAEVDSNSFTDELNTWDSTWYYKVKTVDTSGNTSSGTAWTSGNTDTTNPDAPTSLSVDSGTVLDADGHAIPYLDCTWTDSTTEDVQAHELEFEFDIADDSYATSKPETRQAESPYRYMGAPGNVAYRVRARAIDDANLKSSWTGYQSGTTPKDSTKPSPPSNASDTGLFKAIELSWDNASDADLAYVKIYRYGSDNFSSASEIGQVRGTKFVDENLNVSASYYYWATSVDTSGNESDSQLAFGQCSTDSTAPAVPTGLSVTPQTVLDEDGHQISQLDCSWDANSEDDFDHYEVKWVIDSGTPSVTTTRETSHLIAGIQANKSYSVQVRAVDRVGNASNYCSASSGTTSKDSQAPNNPTNVQTSSLYKSIKVEWDAPASNYKDIAYYEVWQATSGAGANATKLAEIKGTSFTDELNTWDATFYYRIKSVDNSGNTSSGTSWTSGNTDTTAPNAPSSLNVSEGTIVDADGHIIPYLDCTWTDSSSSDVQSHELEFEFDIAGDSYATSNPETRGADSPYRYMGAPGNVAYRVRVRAIDDAGLKSSWTGYQSGTTPTDSTQPETPTCSLTGIKGGLRIGASYAGSWPADWATTKFYAEAGDNTPTTLVHEGRVKEWEYDTGTSYVTWYARVKVVDTSGNESEYSAAKPATPIQQSSADLGEDSVGATALQDGSVGDDQVSSISDVNILIDDLVTLANWADGSGKLAYVNISGVSIDTADIVNAAITTAKIDTAAVDTAQIADAAITTAKIDDAQITTAKIGDAQVTNAKIDSLSADNITAGTISASISISTAGSIGFTDGPSIYGSGGWLYSNGGYLTGSSVQGQTVTATTTVTAQSSIVMGAGGGTTVLSGTNLTNVTIAASCDGGSGLNVDQVDGYDAGNGSEDVAVSNGTVCTNLNADMLDGQHASEFYESGDSPTFNAVTATSCSLVSHGGGAFPSTQVRVSTGLVKLTSVESPAFLFLDVHDEVDPLLLEMAEGDVWVSPLYRWDPKRALGEQCRGKPHKYLILTGRQGYAGVRFKEVDDA